jgi:membrane protease subunit HflC
MRTFLLIVLILVLLAWAGTAVYTVDRTEFAYVTQFGRHVETLDGETDAGLHLKWPWPVQAVQRFDHRLQAFDLPGAELLTHDPRGKTIDKTLTVDAYVCWQIAGPEGVDRFIRTVGTVDRARSILGQRVSSRLGAAIGNMAMDELISVAPTAVVEDRTERLRQQLLGAGDPAGEQESLKDVARQAYGIEIVDIRLRRFNHPPQVRDAIFDRIRSERNKKVADYQSEGAKLAADIRSKAEREARDTLTEARAREQRLRREAEIKADEIRNQAHAQDREFYAFLQKLEAYQRMLGDAKDVLLLSSKNELFDLLLKPPRPGGTLAPGSLASPAPPHPTLSPSEGGEGRARGGSGKAGGQ